MRIINCSGYELEKAQPNTSEDFFNRSEVIFEDDGQEKTLHVLYIRYYDENFGEYIPALSGQTDPIFEIGEKRITFKDLVAIICLIKNPSFRQRKRIFINTHEELAGYFEGVNISKVREIFEGMLNQGGYQLTSPLQFLRQPSS